jgi:predicted ribosomally synthesized peptide with SipW-like signal peptide
MKKILMSVAVIGFVGAIAAGATGAFFSDTETSTGNTFTAGSLDLKIDSVQHYNGNICVMSSTAGAKGIWVGNAPYPVAGSECDGSWAEANLGAHKFWNFNDLKPGDLGENTISLHVYDNDAWGKMKMTFMKNLDNSCTEPESSVDGTCDSNTAMPGELLGKMKFETWLDQGMIPGFQCGALGAPGTARCPRDHFEGDNIWQHEFRNDDTIMPGEPMIKTEMVAMTLDSNRNPMPISGNPQPGSSTLPVDSFFDVFFDIELAMKGVANVPPGDPDFDLLRNSDGHHNYGRYHGIARDGRMVGSTTYYIGWKWMLPGTVGNEVQSDSLMGDMMFEVVQHRNNPQDAE